MRKLLVDIPKEMHWNTLRFCIGPVPDRWLEIADEAGLLIGNGREGIPLNHAEARNVIVRNNISLGNKGSGFHVQPIGPGHVADHNRIDKDPLFVDVKESDFHLRAGSPAIGSGLLKGAPKSDFDGTRRPQGDAIDLGAFEFVPPNGS